MKKWLMSVLLMAVALVAGCASKVPTTEYYLLSAGNGPFKAAQSDKPGYFIAPVVLADHLNRTALVMLQGQQQVQLAHYHVWAEPLASGVTQVLEYELNQICACEVTSARQGVTDNQQRQEIRLIIDQMAVNEAGQVTLSGSYVLEGQPMQRFYLQQTLTENGFEAAVLTQRRLLAQLATHIVQHSRNGVAGDSQ